MAKPTPKNINDGKPIDLNEGRLSYMEKRQRVRAHIDAMRDEETPSTLYRSDLLRRVQNARYGSNVSKLGVREIAGDTGLAVGTVTDALKGEATKIETLWTMSRYFGVPWFLMFDLERRYIFQVREDGTGIDIDGTQIPATPDSASGSKRSKKK